jgi:hypothetical protein
MMYVIFEKWAVERVKWSALIAIGDSLEQDGMNDIEYFVPSCFNPEGGDMPATPEASIEGVFTWHWNYFDIQEYYKTKKIDTFTIDWGFLGREKGYQFILRNNTFVNNKPDNRFKALNCRVRAGWEEGGHILVAKQNHHLEWYSKAIDVLKDKTNREIRVREFDEKKPLEKDLKGASALVTYNSTCLYKALLQRVPIFCSKDCPAANSKEAVDSRIININFALLNDVGKVEDPVPFLSNVAYNQYTLEEIREGLWIKEIL